MCHICLLDNMIWHHALPITSGRRYALVCFYKCNWKRRLEGTGARSGGLGKATGLSKRQQRTRLLGAVLGFAAAAALLRR